MIATISRPKIKRDLSRLVSGQNYKPVEPPQENTSADDEVIRAEREAIQFYDGQPSEVKRELTWFDLCAICKSVLYTERNQWFCPKDCYRGQI